MPQTFDIRFARSAGFAAMLEAPANTFRWKGAGSLRIDAEGISIAVKRGLLSLFARHTSRRIEAAELREVYREGEALRVEFASDAIKRGRLRFWASDSATAAEIVRLLPTTRTVEMEQSADAPAPDKSDSRWRLAILLTATLVIACGALFFKRSPAGSPVPSVDVPAAKAVPTVNPASSPEAQASPVSAALPSALPRVALPATDEDRSAVDTATPAESTASVEIPAPEPVRPAAAAARSAVGSDSDTAEFVPYVPTIRVRPEDLVIPIPKTTLAYDKARKLLQRFEAGASKLTQDYRHDRELYESGQLNGRQFAEKLDEYARLWAVLAERTPFADEYKELELIGIRSTLRAAVRYQLNFFEAYAAGLRKGDAGTIEQAFEELAKADEMLVRARLYVS